jgi:hypothetical protein
MRILRAKSQKDGLVKVLVSGDGVVCLLGTAIRQTLWWMVMAVNEVPGSNVRTRIAHYDDQAHMTC